MRMSDLSELMAAYKHEGIDPAPYYWCARRSLYCETLLDERYVQVHRSTQVRHDRARRLWCGPTLALPFTMRY
jgi:hypothetical protein